MFRHGPHHGEEPPVSGTRGSGTIFFSHCTMQCRYCQNYPWSQEHRGETLDPESLARLMLQIQAADCHNLNLVSPTPWLPAIESAWQTARQEGFNLPVVYNTSGYERTDILEHFASMTRVYLTDLRYARPETAAVASGAPDYVDKARSALQTMSRLTGPLRLDPAGIARSGTICRILMLPGHADEAVMNLEWIADHLGNAVAVSLMSQYLPAHRASETAPWNRRITRQEYESAMAAMERLEFEQGWMQDFEGDSPPELVGFNMPAGEGSAGHHPHQADDQQKRSET
ncbi:MAG: hypothetical protein A2269_08835 [Lentisphaerae bacterium RIFOXYA12_FULL_60_10]|nr:MAG: hypothetical protein A2269_08835 [Lentisphaerae bacterium RIFOXYA12_FULL_60_10]